MYTFFHIFFAYSLPNSTKRYFIGKEIKIKRDVRLAQAWLVGGRSGIPTQFSHMSFCSVLNLDFLSMLTGTGTLKTSFSNGEVSTAVHYSFRSRFLRALPRMNFYANIILSQMKCSLDPCSVLRIRAAFMDVRPMRYTMFCSWFKALLLQFWVLVMFEQRALHFHFALDLQNNVAWSCQEVVIHFPKTKSKIKLNTIKWPKTMLHYSSNDFTKFFW